MSIRIDELRLSLSSLGRLFIIMSWARDVACEPGRAAVEISCVCRVRGPVWTVLPLLAPTAVQVESETTDGSPVPAPAPVHTDAHFRQAAHPQKFQNATRFVRCAEGRPVDSLTLHLTARRVRSMISRDSERVELSSCEAGRTQDQKKRSTK